MPVPDQAAALQFFVEAMRANTAVLERVGKAIQGVQAEQKETLRMVHDTRERVIRLESGGQTELIVELRAKLVTMEKEIDDLKTERDRRHGAVGAFEWAARFGPWLLALALGILAFAGWEKTA